jgi:hypothetical protein
MLKMTMMTTLSLMYVHSSLLTKYKKSATTRRVLVGTCRSMGIDKQVSESCSVTVAAERWGEGQPSWQLLQQLQHLRSEI